MFKIVWGRRNKLYESQKMMMRSYMAFGKRLAYFTSNGHTYPHTIKCFKLTSLDPNDPNKWTQIPMEELV